MSHPTPARRVSSTRSAIRVCRIMRLRGRKDRGSYFCYLLTYYLLPPCKTRGQGGPIIHGDVVQRDTMLWRPGRGKDSVLCMIIAVDSVRSWEGRGGWASGATLTPTEVQWWPLRAGPRAHRRPDSPWIGFKEPCPGGTPCPLNQCLLKTWKCSQT